MDNDVKKSMALIGRALEKLGEAKFFTTALVIGVASFFFFFQIYRYNRLAPNNEH